MIWKHLPPRVLRIVQFFTLIMFVAMTPRLVADECHDFSSQGWYVNSICATRWDNGNYAGSYCQPNQNISPWARYQTMCLPGMDPGTCTGSNCQQEPTCTDHGVCNTDFDCCGLNVCDPDLHKCQDSTGGGSW